MKKYDDTNLEYAATARCKCGAGLAQPLDSTECLNLAAWICSKVLKGETEPEGHDSYPFAFYKIREETSINNNGGQTTRPEGTVARIVGKAKCGNCGATWQSEPYIACGQSHHWFPGNCPNCDNDCGGHGHLSSEDKRPRIEAGYHTVVL